MPLSDAQYRTVLVDSGLVSKTDFDRALEEAKTAGRPVEAVLVDFGLFRDEEIGKLIGDAYGVKFVNMRQVKVDYEAAKGIPELFAKKQGVIAWGWKNGVRQVATVDPLNLEVVEFLEKKLGEPVEVQYTTPNALAEAFTAYSSDIAAQVNRLAEQFEDIAKSGRGAAERGGPEDVIVKLVDLMLRFGYDNGASDIHVEPHERLSLARYRVDGVLHDAFKLPKAIHDSIVSRVKILSNLRTDEHFAAQDGKFRVRLDNENVDIRVSIIPIVEGEKVVMRLLAQRGKEFTLENLGLDPVDLDRVREAAEQPYGMLLATGPTGCGKTTTMYAVLRLLNQRDVNIATIEDPVEYDIEGVNQIQVNLRTNLTFAHGLRSIVRQDPDIILVGEIRDEETAGIAVNAAMTGHLVLSTLHTNDAATTLPRLLDMDVEPFLIASSINVIIAQRLVRRICPSCIRSTEIDLARLRKALGPALFAKYFEKKKTSRVFAGKGCNACHASGYIGRTGIFETLRVTPRIRELIMARANAGEIQAAAMEEGMTTMIEDGVRKMLQGVTTMDEVLRVVR
jgi:type IV pilus assembly protein PilB